MHVALLANLKKNAPTWEGMSPDHWDDLDSEKTIHAINEAIEAGGHQVTFLEGDVTLYDNLGKVKPRCRPFWRCCGFLTPAPAS